MKPVDRSDSARRLGSPGHRPAGHRPDHEGGGQERNRATCSRSRDRKTRTIDSFHIIVASISTIQSRHLGFVRAASIEQSGRPVQSVFSL